MEERIRKRDLRRQMAAKRAVLMRNQQAANDPIVRRRMAAKKKKASQKTVSIKAIELQTKMALRSSQFKKSLEAKARLEKAERIKNARIMKEEMRKQSIGDKQTQKEVAEHRGREEQIKKEEAERKRRMSEVVKKREEQRKNMEEQIKKIKDKKLTEITLDDSKKESGILSEAKEEDIIAQNVETTAVEVETTAVVNIKEELEVKQLVIAQLNEVDVSEEKGRTVLKFSKDYELTYDKTRGLFGILVAISSHELVKGTAVQNLLVSNKNGKIKDLKITLGSRSRSANLLKVQVKELDKPIEASADIQHKGQLKLYINLFSTSWGSKQNVIVISKDSRIELIH